MEGVMPIELSQGQWAIVDEGDYERINEHIWTYSNGYAYRMTSDKPRKRITMHRQVLGDWDSEEIDHINGNRADNRRCNLRPCTKAENRRNIKTRRKHASGKSIYKGVYPLKTPGTWGARIVFEKEQHNLGEFLTEEAAARAYDAAATYYHGHFAGLNFPADAPLPFTPREKRRPTSSYPGVSLNDRGSWTAGITVNRQQIPLGRYPTEAEAIAARKAAEVKYGRAPSEG